MNLLVASSRPVRIAVGEIRIAAASRIEAQRLADALPAALHRAVAAVGDGMPRRASPADRVAHEIVAQIGTRLERPT